MGSELVTVIIPCYNQGRFLGEAVESVVRQSHRGFDVVVVDDGSTDDTAEVAARYSEVRLVRQGNRGLAAARNCGLAESRGEFLVFLDADDRLLPDAMASGLRCLAAHPQAAFAYGHVKLIAGDGAPLPTPHQVNVERDHYVELLRNNYIWTPGAVMYRRKVFDFVGGFDGRFNASADFDLNVRVARNYPVRCCGQAVLEYRLHGDNMTRNYEVMLKAAVSARRAQRRYVRGDEACRRAWREGIREVRRGYGDELVRQVREWLRAGDCGGAAHGMLTLLWYHPQGAARVCLPKVATASFRRLRAVFAITDSERRIHFEEERQR